MKPRQADVHLLSRVSKMRRRIRLGETGGWLVGFVVTFWGFFGFRREDFECLGLMEIHWNMEVERRMVVFRRRRIRLRLRLCRVRVWRGGELCISQG